MKRERDRDIEINRYIKRDRERGGGEQGRKRIDFKMDNNEPSKWMLYIYHVIVSLSTSNRE